MINSASVLAHCSRLIWRSAASASFRLPLMEENEGHMYNVLEQLLKGITGMGTMMGQSLSLDKDPCIAPILFNI